MLLMMTDDVGNYEDNCDDDDVMIIISHYNHINFDTHTYLSYSLSSLSSSSLSSSFSFSSSGDLKRSLHGHTERITCVTAKKDMNNNNNSSDSDINDDALIMSCTISGNIRIWNYATG